MISMNVYDKLEREFNNSLCVCSQTMPVIYAECMRMLNASTGTLNNAEARRFWLEMMQNAVAFRKSKHPVVTAE